MPQPRFKPSTRSLASIRAFKDVPADALARVEKICIWRNYDSAQSIVQQLDKSDEVYFIISGTVRVSLFSANGKTVTFCDLGTGEIFGEYAAIDGGLRSASIEALESCQVASMSAAAFRNVTEHEPAMSKAIQRHLVAKIRELTTRVYEISALAVSNRIDAELLRLARDSRQGGNVACIDSPPTHAEIASRTSTHREAVTRELGRLIKLGLIEKRGRGLVIKDIGRLAELVECATCE